MCRAGGEKTKIQNERLTNSTEGYDSGIRSTTSLLNLYLIKGLFDYSVYLPSYVSKSNMYGNMYSTRIENL